jgi:proteasome lid subunit RPN8/RPN11
MTGVDQTIRIRAGVIDEIVAHARDEAPVECCGLLLGSGTRIEGAYRTRNSLLSPTRYQVAAEDHFAALRAARTAGLAVVGSYHSHPRSSAAPSPTDLAEALHPDFVWVVVGLRGDDPPDVRAYTLEAGNFRELTLVTFY